MAKNAYLFTRQYCAPNQVSSNRRALLTCRSVLLPGILRTRIISNVFLQEKKEGIIRLNDDVNVIRCFIDFCYGGSYDKEKRSEGVSEVLHHAMVYTTAIFFDNHDLQALATERFTSAGEAKEMVWTTTDKNSLEIIRRVFCNTSSRSDPLRMALVTLLQKRTLDIAQTHCGCA